MLWEPRELGKCRDKSAFGDGCDTCNGDPGDSGVPKRDSFEKGNQSLDFPHFFDVRAYSVNGELAKPRNFARNQDDLPRTFTDAFYEQVGPPQTANPRDSGLFCLLLLLERPSFVSFHFVVVHVLALHWWVMLL